MVLTAKAWLIVILLSLLILSGAVGAIAISTAIERADAQDVQQSISYLTEIEGNLIDLRPLDEFTALAITQAPPIRSSSRDPITFGVHVVRLDGQVAWQREVTFLNELITGGQFIVSFIGELYLPQEDQPYYAVFYLAQQTNETMKARYIVVGPDADYSLFAIEGSLSGSIKRIDNQFYYLEETRYENATDGNLWSEYRLRYFTTSQLQEPFNQSASNGLPQVIAEVNSGGTIGSTLKSKRKSKKL